MEKKYTISLSFSEGEEDLYYFCVHHYEWAEYVIKKAIITAKNLREKNRKDVAEKLTKQYREKIEESIRIQEALKSLRKKGKY